MAEDVSCAGWLRLHAGGVLYDGGMEQGDGQLGRGYSLAVWGSLQNHSQAGRRGRYSTMRRLGGGVLRWGLGGVATCDGG